MFPSPVTVFGGSGFIGRYVVKRLADAGVRVRVAVRRPDKALFLKPLGDVGQIIPVAANVAQPESVHRAIADSNAVVNLVGILFESAGRRFKSIHAEGAKTVAEASAKAGVKSLVHMSAIGADDHSPALYGRSKAAGEAASKAAFAGVKIVRPSIVFGPEDDFFNRFGAMARVAPALPLIGGGDTRFQPVYVDDVAAAIVALLAQDDQIPKTYLLGGPEIKTFKDLLQLVLSYSGRKRLLLPIPTAIASAMASVTELLPVPPLTRDQVAMLQADNVVTPGYPTLKALGIEPQMMAAIVPPYMARYRRGGGQGASRLG